MILLGEQIVKFKDGTQKTLEEFVAEGAILTPETPVTVSDESMELEDYIESLIPEPPTPGAGSWNKLCDFTVTYNTEVAWPEAIQNLFNDPQYNDILIVISNLIGSSKNTCTSLFLPIDEFSGDRIEGGMISIGMANTDTDNYQYAICLTTVKDGGIYKLKPFWNYTPAFSSGLKLKIYAR